MKSILIAGSALALIAAPASAQILGGGGLGGVLGGSSSVGGLPSLPSTSNFPNDPIGGAFGAAGSGSASGTGSAHVDRHRGHVDASGNGNGNGDGSLNGVLNAPAGSANGNGRASGSASGGGSASADLIGADQLRSTAQGAFAQARSTGQQARGSTSGLVDGAGGISGNASGNASGAANGSAGYASGALAAAGSAAAGAQGTFSVEKGMSVLDASGDKIGKIQQVVANGRGQVQSLLVKVDGERAMIPAGNFSAAGNGNAVVSAMGQGTIEQIASQQNESGR